MHHSAYVNAEKFYYKYCEDNIENKKILDVGSYDVNGTMKPIFQKGEYIGLDMEQGPNVDIVGVSHKIPFEKDEFDIVISSSCFEHDDMFWISFQEMCRVLKPGGYMYVQAPSNGPYHGWPGDNWRFYIDSWKALEKWGKKLGYDIELVEHYIDETTPAPPSEGPRFWNDSIGIYRKKPIEYKKVALISSFCNNQEKMDVLEKNIKIIKSHGLDVIVISPFNLPEYLTKQCDYFLITKDNPILNWPTRAMYAWRGLNFNGTKYNLAKTYPDYGFAGLTQIKQLSQIALGLDYSQFYHMIYDIKIDENVIEGFYSNRTNSVYPSKRKEEVWAVGLHYLIFNRENLKNFISYINLETYLGVKHGDAFKVLHTLQDKLNYVIEETPVEDEIYYYENVDFFNFSPIEEIKFFIENDDENPSSIKILFYDIVGEKEIKVKIDETEAIHTISSLYLIDLGFNKFNLQTVTIEVDDTNYDITDIIKEIKHSTLNVTN
jgi:SAM-dependent methyltransferase